MIKRFMFSFLFATSLLAELSIFQNITNLKNGLLKPFSPVYVHILTGSKRFMARSLENHYGYKDGGFDQRRAGIITIKNNEEALEHARIESIKKDLFNFGYAPIPLSHKLATMPLALSLGLLKGATVGGVLGLVFAETPYQARNSCVIWGAAGIVGKLCLLSSQQKKGQIKAREAYEAFKKEFPQ